jgi:hypothetical protein
MAHHSPDHCIERRAPVSAMSHKRADSRHWLRFALLAAVMLSAGGFGCGGTEENTEEIASESSTITCGPRLSVYPVRAAHNHGYDRRAGDRSSWTCGAEHSNSDFIGGDHLGNDVWAEEGAPVVAPASGTLRMVGFNSFSGNRVTVEDECGWSYSLFHLQRIEPGIANGRRVEAGQVVGYVGRTGRASNGVVHLHVSLFPNRNYNAGIDPWPYLRRVEKDACGGAFATDPFSFDPRTYLDLHGDLRAAFGDDSGAAAGHWRQHGIAEGRTASLVFGVRYYLAVNPDLATAFDRNYVAAIAHYGEHGLAEGRESSPVFSVQHYLGYYADLRAAFGTDYRAATQHFLDYGINEGRRGSPKFSAASYLARYSDLRQAFGATGYRAALMHYLEWGIAEGRDGS